MHSATAITYETFDEEAAALELAEQICSALPEVGNKCGILFLDPDHDGAAISARLERELDIPVIGATLAAMLTGQGYHADCAFGIPFAGNNRG